MNIMKSLKSVFARPLFKSATFSDPNQNAFFLSSFFNSRKTSAGVLVNAQNSLQLSAYYACIRNISEDVAKLPVKIIRKVASGGNDLVIGSPIGSVFQVAPNPEMTTFTFKELMTSYALGWGNAYAEIVTNGRGEPVELWPIHPGRVLVRRDDNGTLQYEIHEGFSFLEFTPIQLGEKVTLPADRVFHLKGLGPDGITGYSVARLAAESLGTSLAAQQFGGTFFGNNAIVGGVLSHPGVLSKEAQERLIKSWEQRHKGSSKSFRPAVLEEGMKWEATTVPPKDAQFIELREHQVIDIARWFRMPPHKIQDLSKATFSNIEEQNLDYVNDTLMAWLSRWEHEIKRKLIKQPSVFAKFSVQALLRGDMKSRSEFYRTMLNIGSMTINEIRELEDMNPIAGNGDMNFMQSAMTTVDKIVADDPEPAPPASPAEDDNPPASPAEDDDNPPASPDGDSSAVLASLKPVMLQISGRITERERKATTRALEKHAAGRLQDASSWAATFYDQHIAYALDAIVPIAESVERLSGAVICRESMASHIDSYFRNQENEFISACSTDESGFVVNDLDFYQICYNSLEG